MKNWRYEIKEQYVWVGKKSACIQLIPDIETAKFITAIITVPVNPVEKGWSVTDNKLLVSEWESGYRVPDEMDFDEALTRLMSHFKEKAKRFIRLVFAQVSMEQHDNINPFTGEKLEQ